MIKKNVNNGHRRHKCSICGRVRYEKYMNAIGYINGSGRLMEVKTRFGNKCWVCVDNPDCLQKARYFKTY